MAGTSPRESSPPGPPGPSRPPVRLAGLCDPVPPAFLPGPLRTRVAGIPVSDRLEPLLSGLTGPVVTVVATPIHTHVDLALTAVGQGSAVFLEKPPAPSLSGFRRLEDAVARRGAAVQAGFQDLASQAADVLGSLVEAGAVGRLRGVGVAGVWCRDSAYYGRSDWAGRRRLDGRDVVDGVLTNPFAHAVAGGLRAAGARRVEDVVGIEVELYRANPIEADDTSCVRIRTAGGTTLVVAATLAAARPEEPVVTVHGDRGRIEWRYKRGELRVYRTLSDGETSRHPATHVFEPPRLLANLVDHVVTPSIPLLVPLADTGAFTAVLEAVRRAPDPVPIPPGQVTEHLVPGNGPGDTGTVRRVVTGVAEAVHRAAGELGLFSEIGVPWARRGARSAS
ncbi:MAG: hypothetical protein QG622_3004 [Actinomycetota bacterium]|nr:hypothetical protein [Actinomycetota bacterium]